METRNPYLMPYNDPVVKMILRKLHEENLHCGHETLRGIARQQYHIIKVKPMVRNVIEGCVAYTKYRPQFFKQVMGDLSEHRLSQNRPFLNAGVDYCGPFWIHHKVRGKRRDKAYIAVFVCFATKAVHLEFVGDLSTSSFVGALQRFIGRRGRCQTLYCDNATNFVGANNQLKELTDTIHSEKAAGTIMEFCNQKGV
ncbi:uncharacterized protein [Drosophila tropicalis]|uniref:uncharacterized protein n=1 Tax=Drosophila tropicalis TaxID=46794 RepID=UPI0035ABD1EC